MGQTQKPELPENNSKPERTVEYINRAPSSSSSSNLSKLPCLEDGKIENGEIMIMGWKKRKKKKRKYRDGEQIDGELTEDGVQETEDGEMETEDGDEKKRDPLEELGRDIMMKVMDHLDARSVALSLLVCRRWHGVSSADRIWSTKCEELWLGKAHIPRMSQVRGLPKMAAYSISVMDAKRTRITKDDLCDHIWEFHFTKEAPEYWRNLDPYWGGTGPLMRRYFHPDGSQSADSTDKVWGGHECSYSIVTSYIEDEKKIREHYVRINRWPQMSVSRKPDWSWVMTNHLYSYSSIPDAFKEGGTGPVYPIF